MRHNRSTGWIRSGWTMAMAAWLALGIMLPPGASKASVPSEKQVRQLKVMEGILDQILLDSPNFLVFGRDNVHGIYLEELGALLTFEASLTNKHSFPAFFRGGKAGFFGRGGSILIEPGDDEGESSGGEGAADEREGAEEAAEPDSQKYERGKTELVQALLDYGDTMTGLGDAQSVVIVAHLRENDLFSDRRISRLIVRAKVRDLREFAAGRLTEADARNRIRVEEY